MEIITNNVPRDLLCWHDLTPKEREDFDYIKEPEEFDYRFFRYKGEVYDYYEFQRTPDSLNWWDGVQSDSYFSGVLVKYTVDSDRVIVGRYYC
jgi:hypothetical protein